MKTATAASAIPHPMAIGSFVVSAIALILVVGGTFAPGSPFTVHPDALDRKPFALVIGLCYILPIFMGIGGSLFAGQAMNLIEESNGKYRSDGPAFFAIMVGLVAAVAGLLNCFALTQFS